MPVSTPRLVECVREVEKRPEHLVLIVGQPGCGKSKVLRELSAQRGWVLMDARELVTDELLEMLPQSRPQEAPGLMGKEMSRLRADVILLDNIDVLFTPILHLDPYILIRQLSRKHTLVVTWTGEFRNGMLMRSGEKAAEYPAEDLAIIQIG